jgi:hypothetical protein
MNIFYIIGVVVVIIVVAGFLGAMTLSPSPARTPGWVPVQQVELKTERVAIAYRLLFTYASVCLEV